MKLGYWKVRSMSITKMVKNSVRTGDTENIMAVRYWKGISVCVVGCTQNCDSFEER